MSSQKNVQLHRSYAAALQAQADLVSTLNAENDRLRAELARAIVGGGSSKKSLKNASVGTSSGATISDKHAKATRVKGKFNPFEKDSLTQKEVNAVWNRYDKDGSGFLEQKEVESVVQALMTSIALRQEDLTIGLQGLFAEEADLPDNFGQQLIDDLNASGRVKELQGRFDQDNDGKVSKQEFVSQFGAWYAGFVSDAVTGYIYQGERQSARPSSKKVDQMSQKAVAAAWAKADKDGNGYLSVPECEKLLNGIVADLGKQTEDISVGLAGLFGEEELDVDSDDIKGGDTLQAVEEDLLSKVNVARFKGMLDVNGDNKVSKGEFMNSFGAWYATTAKEAVDSYIGGNKNHKKKPKSVSLHDVFAEFDALTGEQVHYIWDTFDADRSLTLDKSELTQLVDALVYNIAMRQSELRTGLVGLFGKAKGNDPEVLRNLVQELNATGRKKELINRFDTNRDGTIGKAEFMANFGEWFASYVKQAMGDTYSEGKKIKKTPEDEVDSLMTFEVLCAWHKADADNNGFVEGKELDRLVRGILQMLVVEKTELLANMQLMYGNEVDVKELAQTVASSIKIDDWKKNFVGSLDANHDGKISKDEFVTKFGPWFNANMKEFFETV